MPQRIAAILALIAFALCLSVGSLHAGNSFGTAVVRAVIAMMVTFLIGLVVGTMAQRMLEENLRAHEQKLTSAMQIEPKNETKSESGDR